MQGYVWENLYGLGRVAAAVGNLCEVEEDDVGRQLKNRQLDGGNFHSLLWIRESGERIQRGPYGLVLRVPAQIGFQDCATSSWLVERI